MAERSFPVPVAHQGPLLGSAATLDEIDHAATAGDDWAVKVRTRENGRILERVLAGDPRLPVGAGDGDAIVGLYRDRHGWNGHGWEPAPPPPETLVLDPDEVAFVARAVVAAAPVFLYPYTPVARIRDDRVVTQVSAAAKPVLAGDADLPAGTKVLAVVDEHDRNAVLDTVAVLPGPKTKRRHDGKWVDDPGWVNLLRSVRPPPVVVLSAAQIPDVMGQIDESTKGEAWVATKMAKSPRRASAFQDRADDMVIEFALVGGPAGKVLSKATPGGRMPHELMTYWSVGPGAAKIRWGTPGAMTRCARYLAKYVGPQRSYSTCNNIGKRLGGPGVAWDVG